MISQSKNRVQAIKSKFENLSTEPEQVSRKKSPIVLDQLSKHDVINDFSENNDKENVLGINTVRNGDSESTNGDCNFKPNDSYLHGKKLISNTVYESKTSLCRQSSDPGKKLHRSHAFRCDRSQKIPGPKRHGSCNGRSETSRFALKMSEKKLSEDRLKRLGDLLEGQMKKENYVPPSRIYANSFGEASEVPRQSIPDSEVPQHILDQYAKVLKTKKNDESKLDAMTDSGVSSETENLDEEKQNKIKKLKSQFEKTETDTNLDNMNEFCSSSETMKLERKNPHVMLTETLKKALKQPLPAGPPPKKPPRTFASPIPEEKKKKNAKEMLEKLEKVLEKRESQKSTEHIKNIYDIAETNLSLKKPKEIHYLCTEILDITHRTLLPNHNTSDTLTNCFNSLNCAIIPNNSTQSLPYTRLSLGYSNRDSLRNCCSCSNDSLDRPKTKLRTFFDDRNVNKCAKCEINEEKADHFKCHLDCKCRKSEFFVDKEPIYDEPCIENRHSLGNPNSYGTLNSWKRGNISKSLEDIRLQENEDQKIYDIPCDISRPETPVSEELNINNPPEKPERLEKQKPKTEFEKLRQNFEIGFQTKSPNEINKSSKHFEKSVHQSTDCMKTISENKIEIKADVEKIDMKNFEEKLTKKLEKPPLTPKPNLNTKLKVSKSSENLCEDGKYVKKCDNKFATETKRYRKYRDDGQKKDNQQLEIDKENLSRLMNEIYATVSAAYEMEAKPGSFPTTDSDANSEDSVKLTRSLTEKRKNYVRRVSSRAAYLESKNANKRFRHQTSVCSYKSDIVDNPYSTFRSWKSFRASQNNIDLNNMDISKELIDRKLDLNLQRCDSTDSKYNLTDSKGNILSMKDDFDIDVDIDSCQSVDNLSIDDKTGCVDIELPEGGGLFNVCLLAGLNYMTGQAYVKSVFPSEVQVPPHIENLIFPETFSSISKGEWTPDTSSQSYSLVLTDERGERSYGYCRRVLPEGTTTCLPLCYCLISKYRAPGFYYKVLQELESHHGSSEVEINSILHQLFETEFPKPGEQITINYSKEEKINNRISVSMEDMTRDNAQRCKTMPDPRRSDANKDENRKNDRLEFYDLENNNGPKKPLTSWRGPKSKTIKRPIDPRADEDCLSTTLDNLGAGLMIKVFGSLLLERKVLVLGDQLGFTEATLEAADPIREELARNSLGIFLDVNNIELFILISSCMSSLQHILYPLCWQHCLIAAVPHALQRDVADAPLPLLAGALTSGTELRPRTECMVIDLTGPSKVLVYQGDESTILPTSSYKTLKTALQMEYSKHNKTDDIKTRNVMISEAFLRFFVDILGDFWKFFSIKEMKDDDLGKNGCVFDKDAFVKNTSSRQNQYFLEWFTETAMFNHFIQNMATLHRYRQENSSNSTKSDSIKTNSVKLSDSARRNSTKDSSKDLVDTPFPDYYELFEERVASRHKNSAKSSDSNKVNYKSAMNKRVKLLKNKLRDLVA